jgi:hypothetical protein
MNKKAPFMRITQDDLVHHVPVTSISRIIEYPLNEEQNYIPFVINLNNGEPIKIDNTEDSLALHQQLYPEQNQ